MQYTADMHKLYHCTLSGHDMHNAYNTKNNTQRVATRDSGMQANTIHNKQGDVVGTEML